MKTQVKTRGQRNSKALLHFAVIKKKKFGGWLGSQKSYIIFKVGNGKCLRLLTRWVGEVKKGHKHAYIMFEWSLTR